MDFIMGGIINFGGNFAPKDWAFCMGQLIPISQNQALYAILGTTWGGDGRTNFALPDMRSRVPIGMGRGIGLTEVFQGQQRGSETHTLNITEMPAHSHEATFTGTGGGGSATATATANVTVYGGGTADSPDPAGRYWGKDPKAGFTAVNAFSSSQGSPMASDAVEVDVTVNGGGGGITGGIVNVGVTGSDQPFSIKQPDLGMAYIIAMQGIFPSRN